jgi:zinc transport system substrate-binding protein
LALRIILIMSPRLLLPVALLALPLVGCGDDAGSDDGLSVVTSIYPIEFVTERVAGDHAKVTTLTNPGQEAHDLELTIEATAKVTEADLLVHGSGFQPAVDEAADENAEGEVLDAMSVLESDEPPFGDAPSASLSDDPHFWLDPVAMATLARAVEDRLAELDPDNAASYEQNADDLVADLESLDQEARSALADCQRRTVVVSHDAFGYLGDRYDLELVGIAGLSPEAEPSLAHLAQLQELVEQEGLTTVFSETLASPKMAETLANDLGIETEVLDPVEGLTDDTSDEDYLSLMRRNVQALEEANGCR